MPVLSANAIRLERDKRLRVMVCDYLQIVARQISFVRAHLVHCEVLASSLNESRELRTIVSIAIRDFDSRNDIRGHSAHQVNLDPIVAFHHFLIAILRLAPLSKTASGEAGRINGEVSLDSLQRQTANLNQFAQERRQSWILKIARDRVVVWRSRQVTLALRIPHV